MGDVSITNNGNPPLPVVTMVDTVVSVCENSSANFMVTVNAGGVVYQWQESNDNGLSWNNLSSGSIYQGVNTNKLTISNCAASMDNYLYRCKITTCAGSVFSDSAFLKIIGLPSIVVQPSNMLQSPGAGVIFNIVANNGQSYQWYENSGSGWMPVLDGGVYNGSNASSLSISDVTGMDGFQYYCIVSGCSSNVFSDTVILTVGQTYNFVSHPVDVSQCAGTSAVFSVTTTGNPSYQWYENQGNGWNALSDGGIYSGVNTATLLISDITGLDGYSYQCVISGNGPDLTSNQAVLNVYELSSISTQPVSVTECPGNSTYFSITASGYNITYQWHINQGNGWVPLSDGGIYSGVNTNVLNISNVSGLDGYEYLCVVSGCNVFDTSAIATLTLYAPPVINTHPVNVIGCSGGAVFTVSASGTALSYQWYENQGNGWVLLSDGGVYSGTNTNTLVISNITNLNNYQYQCIVSTCSYNVVSNSATLTYSSTNIWLGYTTNWDDINNWACGIPTANTNVTIPALPVGGNMPVLSSNGISMCQNIDISLGASINISLGADLTVYGNWDNKGMKNIGEGKVIFSGNIQDIKGTTRFSNITVNTNSEVNIVSSGQELTGILLCNGKLYSNGNLTLISNALGTALISGNSTGEVKGQLTLQRFIPAAKAKGYKHFSTAFSNSVVGDFSNFMTLYLGDINSTPFPTLFTFSETDASPYFSNGWVPAAPQYGVNTPMIVGAGYSAQLGPASNTDITAYLFGEVNNGNYSIPVTRNNPGPGKGDGWNLIGNPYPSPIDLHKINYTASKLNKSVSLYISTSMYNGYYGYYNSALGIGLNGGTRYLGSLHGFFVQCTSTSGGVLDMTNSIRSDVVNPHLYKNEEQIKLPFVKLKGGLIYDLNNLTDETLVVFAPDATIYGEDADYDISKIMNTEVTIPDIYTISDGNKLAMNGLPEDFSEIKEIPIGYKVKINGIYNIKATEIANIPNGVGVYLQDKALNKIKDLQTNSEYIFVGDINSESEGRFSLLIGAFNNTGITSVGEDTNVNFIAWANNGKLYVDVLNHNSKGILQIYDAVGRLVLVEDIEKDGHYIYNTNLPPATYVIRYLSSYTIKTIKVVIN